MKNYYGDKPILPYARTSVEMAQVIADIQAAKYPTEVKRTAYFLFRNESANGRSGVNNNYCGFQADSGRWDSEFDSSISGVVVKKENGTGKERLFLAFFSASGCLGMLMSKIHQRGLYVGGYAAKIAKMRISNSTELAVAYMREWVKGDANYMPTHTEIQNVKSMYAQAELLFQ